ncbi:hypothetical protein FRC01_002692 [Tulasnella sp. 417]|nr:hypothetical protein FRC01_002692 [Tulasnella sp. 417]
MNLKGAIIESHDFACAVIWDIAITNDEQRMILATQVEQDGNGKDRGSIIGAWLTVSGCSVSYPNLSALE